MEKVDERGHVGDDVDGLKLIFDGGLFVLFDDGRRCVMFQVGPEEKHSHRQLTAKEYQRNERNNNGEIEL